ncbi:MAG: prkC 18 [Planctomycetaceae bacterium]|nr:prkC 18 [Planctomycetaceae bacterium]
MPVSVDQFAQQLIASSLMSAADLNALLVLLPAAQQPKDGEQLARFLVSQRKITAFQAQYLYKGKGKSLVLGNYIVLDKLGQGGMGVVFKAEHRRMKRVVALKVLSPTLMKTPEAVRRFQREVEATAKLEHPNIVTAYDADEALGTHFLVSQFVEGIDLAELVRRQKSLSVENAITLVLQVARGLEYAHAHGVVHRDIKPSNLLVDQQGNVKILDMGLARLESAGAEQDQLTGTGQIMGTVDYMAPEQAMDTRNADGRADIYSLGITLWYLLSGRPVFDGETMMAKLLAHRERPIPSLKLACPQVSTELDATFSRMVAKTPAARFQNMTEVIAALERCLAANCYAIERPDTVIADGSQFKDVVRGLKPSR